MPAKYVLISAELKIKLMAEARCDANRMGYKSFIESNFVTGALAENEANKLGLTLHKYKATYPKKVL